MIKYWKPYFNDLKPFDLLDVCDVLERQKNTLESFDECKKQQENGHYFLKITGDQLDHPEVKRLHEKFNHKSVDENNLKNDKHTQLLKWKTFTFLEIMIEQKDIKV